MSYEDCACGPVYLLSTVTEISLRDDYESEAAKEIAELGESEMTCGFYDT